ncbi:MAG: FG-GAP repeat protein [Terrimicrobiaceae bacterium]|nr:FG-GAP repeat protein [Terrimicrobiaceae bacterium]
MQTMRGNLSPPAAQCGHVLAGALLGLLAAVPSFVHAAPFAETQKLTASDAHTGDYFGARIAIDGNVALIGALAKAGAGVNRGAAYIFTFNGAQWVEKQKLTPPVPHNNDYFSGAVAIQGNIAVVGADREDGAGGVDRGAVYIFEFDAGSSQWQEKQRLAASDAQDYDRFGISVALDSDLLLVGASPEDGAGVDRGAVYAFSRDSVSGVWTEQQKLTASDAADYDDFGRAVSLSGSTAVIGAPFRSTLGTYRGGAYIFTHAGNTWTEVKKLIGSDSADNGDFGIATAIDTAGSALIGSGEGSAYFFTHSAGDWLETKKFKSADTSITLGQSVALDDTTAVAGSQNGGAAGKGVVEVFKFDSGNWSAPQIIEGSDDTGAAAVALSGTFLMSGSYMHDSYTGAVYVFSTDPSLIPPTPTGTVGSGVPPTLRLISKAKIKTTAARTIIKGASNGTLVEAAYKVGKKTRIKLVPVVGGVWKFKLKLTSPKTKIVFTALNSANLRSAPAKATILQNP